MYDFIYEIGSAEHLIFRRTFFAVERNHLFKSVQNIKSPILNLEKNILTNVFLFGSDKCDEVINVGILKSKIVNLIKLEIKKTFSKTAN